MSSTLDKESRCLAQCSIYIDNISVARIKFCSQFVAAGWMTMLSFLFFSLMLTKLMAAIVALPGWSYQLERLIRIKVTGAALSGRWLPAGGSRLNKGCGGRMAAWVALPGCSYQLVGLTWIKVVAAGWPRVLLCPGCGCPLVGLTCIKVVAAGRPLVLLCPGCGCPLVGLTWIKVVAAGWPLVLLCLGCDCPLVGLTWI